MSLNRLIYSFPLLKYVYILFKFFVYLFFSWIWGEEGVEWMQWRAVMNTATLIIFSYVT
jgi:hypothetical protein